MVSTRHLGALPDIPRLQRLCRSIAVLDAILEPEWELRYYSFNCQWANDEQMASMRDGSGDDYFLLFTTAGAILKGYAHESPMAASVVATGRPWPGILESVPPEFAGFLNEPAFSIEEATFCIWRKASDASWRVGGIQFPEAQDPDGSEDLLYILDGDPRTYQRWSEEYYETTVPLAVVQHIYDHKPLTAALIGRLNPGLHKDDLSGDIEEIGYPATF